MKTSRSGLWITLGMVVLVIVPVVIFAAVSSRPKKEVEPGKYDKLAECLTEKGVKMYGAYWCDHCKSQKAMFGSSFEKVNYIECSLAGGQGQTEECREAGIEGYPTWEFGDGERLGGEVALETLAEKSGCELE